MQVEVKIDSSCTEPKVVIFTAAVTEEVSALLNKLSRRPPRIISGSREGKIEVIRPGDLIRVYAGGGKVFAVTHKGEYTLRRRLYEIEERLRGRGFVRISNSEIINLEKVNNFDLSFTGTICVKLADGATTYVSKRYVSKLKKILGI